VKLHVFDTNCDCGSGYITRQRMSHWRVGPRCPFCTVQLGPMQYTYLGQGEGETEWGIIKKVRAAYREKMEEWFQERQARREK